MLKTLKKFSLYSDSFKRLSTMQLYYWLLNKYLKALIPISLLVREKPHIPYVHFATARNNLFKIFPLNKLFLAENKLIEMNHHYHNDVKKLVDLLNDDAGANHNFWNLLKRQKDVEIQNNYQRFYFFPAAIEKSNLDPELSIKIINDWIDKFPPSKDISWNTFNCTIRILNWFKILQNLPKNYNLDQKLWDKIQTSIYLQTNFISSNIEYHIPGNHIIIQFYVLWIVCVIFPEWDKSIKRLRKSQKFFATELKNEFLPNGFHFEHSYHYHVQVMLFGLLWLKGMTSININVEKETVDIIKRAAKLTDEFLISEKHIPMIGDNCFSFLTRNIYEDIKLFQKLKPLIFSNDYPAAREENIIDIEGLYVIARTNNSEIIFDTGSIGLESNPGHGHSDLLSFVYTYNGLPIFIDPGARKYSQSPKDLLLKKTTSHNTISIANEDQAKLWGFFRWAYLPNKLMYSIEQQENCIVLSGEFAGFKNIGGINHKRVVTLSNKIFEIEDYVYGVNGRPLSLNFILHPEVVVSDKGGNFSTNGNISFELSVSSEFEYQIIIEPFDVYPSYDIPFPSNKICVNFLTKNKPFYSKVSILFKSLFVENKTE